MAQGVASNASTVLMTLWALAGVTFIFVLLRLYTRIIVLKMCGTDDHCYNEAFLSLYCSRSQKQRKISVHEPTMMLLPTYNILIQLSAEYGFGRDINEIDSLDDSSRAILYEISGRMLLITGNILAKLYVGFFLDRLITSREHKIVIWILPVFAFSFFVMVSMFVSWLPCRPTAYLWDRRIDGHYDVDPGPTAIHAGTLSVFVDFWYSGFPWYLLYAINMSPKGKIVIGSSMSLGVVAAACGTERAVELNKIGSPNYPTIMIGISIPICLPLYKDTIARVLSRKGDPCCFTERHEFRGTHGEIGVFGTHTIGGTPYASNRQANPACDNEKAYTDTSSQWNSIFVLL
ncbi:hypothetical protein F5Y09DRAFT_353589 [Xylaria sp. FL1042]|nr:hypothetical protein F5Y09DRAFT_353589 [Xylaria sp. FL1042]